ncbi:AAA domain-containing protein, putative AbiEii toxin, Type IV TA system [Pedobacter hartonius]|uniref:AAA domain-containing protein, putative AbiEii toxin, Type IV TA system n=1 Tax=Pedobacter hartonius TaxID=425514 RepID=A0A1H3VYJ3_9SPHI|nr:AAA domain-containing protein, putative AbiEii toxin, Type IV TA system [Pedobacter hartonius]
MIGKNGSGKSNLLESLNDALSIFGFRRAGFKSAVLQFMADNGEKITMELDKLSKMPDPDFLDDNDVIEDFDSRIKTAIRIYRDGEKIYDNISNILPSALVRRVSPGSLSMILRRLDYNHLVPKYLTFQIPQTLDCIDIAGHVTVVLNLMEMCRGLS